MARFSTNLLGMICLSSGLVLFSINDSIIKWMSPHYALHELMLFRSSIALVILFTIIFVSKKYHFLKTRRPLLNLVRGMLLVCANMFFYLGAAAMPLAEVFVLFYASPILVCLFAVIFFGEKIDPVRWVSIFLGFAGVIIMLRPGTEFFSYVSLLPLLSALSYASMHMMTKKLGMQDQAITLTIFIQYAFLIICIPMGLVFGDGSFGNQGNISLDFLFREWALPAGSHFVLIVVCGTIVAFGGMLISQAYRTAEASAIAPFEYSSLPTALIIGYYVWGDWPDYTAFLGSSLIVLSGFLVAYFSKSGRIAIKRD